MRDGNEAALLQAIAENYEDDSGRLVLADWLEEGGDAARSEFVRVQCGLAAPGLPEERRLALRGRELDLLEAHRQEWLQALGLPVEDVRFERGLVSGVRLSEWEDGRLLEPEHAKRLVTLTELDLSGLRIGNAGLTAFARRARLPALRKLILCDNDVTESGVTALAKAAGLPRLETVYLFQNRLGQGSRAILEKAEHFRLTDLDLGERPEGYCMSRGEADLARRQYLRTQLFPAVARYFTKYKRLRSAMLCVAQYWADEANDAVHGTLIVSELPEPTLQGLSWEGKSGIDPNIPNTPIQQKYGGPGSVIYLWGEARWDDNGESIPLWAGFAPEEGHQEYQRLDDVYAPAVMFFRHGGYELLPLRRPHLDGIRPEAGWEE